MATTKKPTTPAERAGKIPGALWQSVLNGMAHHVYVARTEMTLDPESALAHLCDVEDIIKNLRDYILDGKE